MKHSFIAAAALLMSLPAMAASPNGKALFQENCATCHGPSGQGGVGPKLVGDASHWKTKVFERAVLNGVDDEGKPLNPPMPHWKDASFKSDKGAAPRAAEIDAIQHYLRALK